MQAGVDLAVACVDALWPLAAQAPQTWLSPSETQRLERIRAPGRQREFVASRCLMRLLLSAHTGFDRGWQSWVLQAPDNASPVVHACRMNGAGLHLNLSHSQGLLACAVSHHPVGVDLEVRRTRRRDVAGLSTLVCSAQEQSWLAGLPDEGTRQSAFLQLWTRKEAYCKWRGTGLDLPLLTALCSQAPCPPQSAIAACGSRWAGEWAGRSFDLSVCTGALPVAVRIRSLHGLSCPVPAQPQPWALVSA